LMAAIAAVTFAVVTWLPNPPPIRQA